MIQSILQSIFQSWPTLSLVLLLNMIITGFIGLATGILGGWAGHMWAVARDKQARRWQELHYWRNIFERNLEEVQKIARVSGALGYVYSDDERDITVHTLREQYTMRQAKKARQKIVSLSDELGIDSGISRDDVRLQRSQASWN